MKVERAGALGTWLLAAIVAMGVGVSGVAFAQVQDVPEADRVGVRHRMFIMEGVLERAVQVGVDNLRRRVRAVMPDDALIQGGVAQVRGFPLEGYGVFFDVEVPALRRSLAWSMRTMHDTGLALARDLAQMRGLVQSIGDPRAQAEFDRALRRIQQQVGPMPSVQADVPAAGSVGATTQPVSSDASLTAATVSDLDPQLVNDPNEAYTQEVRAAVVDAMIENGGQLALRDEEWLTIAARDSAPVGPLVAGDPAAATLVIRVRGADLSAYRVGRLTLDQIRDRVEVSEF